MGSKKSSGGSFDLDTWARTTRRRGGVGCMTCFEFTTNVEAAKAIDRVWELCAAREARLSLAQVQEMLEEHYGFPCLSRSALRNHCKHHYGSELPGEYKKKPV